MTEAEIAALAARRDRLKADLAVLRMGPLRKLVAAVATIEAVQDGSYRPGHALDASGTSVSRFVEAHELPMSQLDICMTNLHLAVERLADYPVIEWDGDPLVIMRQSRLDELLRGA